MAHVPVLLTEVIESLNLKEGNVIIDGTAGGGGHAREILKRITPGGVLVAFDRDEEAIDRLKVELSQYRESLKLIKSNFVYIKRVIEDLKGIDKIDGAVFDLGMSSYQVDDSQRGFSFKEDGPLDMRFDRDQDLSAYDIVNRLSSKELEEIIREFGEERHARLVAKNICFYRKNKKITSTGELRGIIKKAIGSKYSRQRLDPAARTFQALRISTNDELASITRGVSDAVDLLAPGGRICVISFHSLEDRIIKNIFRDAKKAGGMELVTKKPMVPDREETFRNPRARSAKLRIGEKI